MMKISKIGLMLALLSLCYLVGSKETLAQAEQQTSKQSRLNLNFEYATNHDDCEWIILTFKPETPGNPGIPKTADKAPDGFMVFYQNKKFFIPEGYELGIPNDRQYNLTVVRMYALDDKIRYFPFLPVQNVLIYGPATKITLNINKPILPGGMPDEYLDTRIIWNGEMKAPAIYFDFDKDQITVTSPPCRACAYSAPRFDAFEIFMADPGNFGGCSQNARTIYLDTSSGGSVNLPNKYCCCTANAVGLVNDPGNDRVIEGPVNKISP